MKIASRLLVCVALILLVSCTSEPATKSTDNLPNSSQMANPASSYCVKQGGTSEIRTADDGSQTGYCVLKDGAECEEWAFFRGQCGK